MVYVVRATSKDGEIFSAEAETKHHAIKLAKNLRELGMPVTITGSDGKPVDETEDQ
jgi:hypothetical protein